MKKIFSILNSQFSIIALAFSMAMTACNPNSPEPQGNTITFTESDEIFANPERGLYLQTYYTSADLNSKANASIINYNRKSPAKISLYLHSYYLTDYMSPIVPKPFWIAWRPT